MTIPDKSAVLQWLTLVMATGALVTVLVGPSVQAGKMVERQDQTSQSLRELKGAIEKLSTQQETLQQMLVIVQTSSSRNQVNVDNLAQRFNEESSEVKSILQEHRLRLTRIERVIAAAGLDRKD